MGNKKKTNGFFEVDPHQCDVYSAGLTFMEMIGVDNIKKFVNIEKKDKMLTIDFLTKNAIPYAISNNATKLRYLS